VLSTGKGAIVVLQGEHGKRDREIEIEKKREKERRGYKKETQ
jgi:hypothetical protein